MKLLKITTFFCFFFVLTIVIFPQTTKPTNISKLPTAQFRLGVSWGSSLFSNKEQFEFTIGNNQKIILKSSNRVAYFTPKFAPGQVYNLTQLSGPRTCNMWGMNQGTFANQDILVSVDCGQPPLSIFKIEFTGIEQGESFNFADSHGRTMIIPFSTTRNLGGYPVGDDYSVTQTGGPRSCRLTNNQGVVPNTQIIVKADCSKNSLNPVTNNNGNTGISNPNKIKWDLVSRSTDDKNFGTFYDSTAPVIGGIGDNEGRYVAFVSYAPKLGGATGKFRQIIWRDRNTGETKVISVTPTGEEGNHNSFAPAISADGKSVAFESYATNLVGDDTNKVRDIFLWRESTGKVERVSTGNGSVEANYESFEPTISGDGNLVAFTSYASNLIPNIQGQSSNNVYLKNMQSGSIEIISFDEKTKKGGGGSNPSISEDGSRIAFYNYFPLTSDDKNTLWDIYLWERGSQKLKRISKTAEGADRDQGSESSSRVISPTISGNGKFVTFATTAKNMVGGDTNGVQDAFVVEVDTGRLQRLSFGKDELEPDLDTPIGQGEKIPISYDGNWVVFNSNAKNLGGNIIMRNISTKEVRVISTTLGITVGTPVISRNGGYIVFPTNQQLDERFKSSGIFGFYTGITP